MLMTLLVCGSRPGVKSRVETELAQVFQIIVDEVSAEVTSLDVPASLL